MAIYSYLITSILPVSSIDGHETAFARFNG
jgi:hypothetical protein